MAMAGSVRPVLAFGVAVVAFIALLAALPKAASAGHDDCVLTVGEPTLSYGIFAFATTSVECQSLKNTITISAELERDGVVVQSVVERRHKDNEWFAYVLVNDAPGDQTWCFRVPARINPHTLGPITRCATF